MDVNHTYIAHSHFKYYKLLSNDLIISMNISCKMDSAFPVYNVIIVQKRIHLYF